MALTDDHEAPTGNSLANRLLTDPYVTLTVIGLVFIEIYAPLTMLQAQMLLFLVIPVLIFRTRSYAQEAVEKKKAEVTNPMIAQFRAALLASQMAEFEDAEIIDLRDAPARKEANLRS